MNTDEWEIIDTGVPYRERMEPPDRWQKDTNPSSPLRSSMILPIRNCSIFTSQQVSDPILAGSSLIDEE